MNRTGKVVLGGIGIVGGIVVIYKGVKFGLKKWNERQEKKNAEKLQERIKNETDPKKKLKLQLVTKAQEGSFTSEEADMLDNEDLRVILPVYIDKIMSNENIVNMISKRAGVSKEMFQKIVSSIREQLESMAGNTALKLFINNNMYSVYPMLKELVWMEQYYGGFDKLVKEFVYRFEESEEAVVAEFNRIKKA